MLMCRAVDYSICPRLGVGGGQSAYSLAIAQPALLGLIAVSNEWLNDPAPSRGSGTSLCQQLQPGVGPGNICGGEWQSDASSWESW